MWVRVSASSLASMREAGNQMRRKDNEMETMT